MGESEAEIILELAKARGALLFGEFKLSAGGTSNFYFDGRIITLDPEAGYHIAKAILPILRACDAQAIAGPTLGADPIVSAVSVVSHLEGQPVPGLIVRKEAKDHGGQRAIEGPITGLGDNARIAVVDDTCTSGSSLMHAVASVEAAGHQVVKVISVLDRNEGGSEEIRRQGYDFVALLVANDRGEIETVTHPESHPDQATRKRNRPGPA
ncbi:orotate phosphoribosyltransferase [Dehalococcoidia bacterium]|nr:orotate phosphoribosyltransferase [Dehalococcoidia bacterium]